MFIFMWTEIVFEGGKAGERTRDTTQGPTHQDACAFAQNPAVSQTGNDVGRTSISFSHNPITVHSESAV